MKLLHKAEERIRILQEILSITPTRIEEGADLNMLQEVFQRRQDLLNKLPTIVTDKASPPEVFALLKQAEVITKEILRRDQEITHRLEEARNKVRKLLNQAGAQDPPKAMLVRKTA